MSLSGKKILVGVSGGIAAYKIPHFIRLLVKDGAEVKVIMTPAAADFVTPLTLATVSKNPVDTVFFNTDDGRWTNHVELGLWADVMIIAPLTANTMAKMVHGESENLLLATYLSARCPVFFCPAMDLDMYAHPATQENIQTLIQRGNILIPAASGELASGLSGEGRMEEPENIAEILKDHFLTSTRFSGKKILITAGPTYEAIDPVRFIGNHSSGKMGIDIADTLAAQGAEIILVCGPSAVKNKNGNVTRHNVVSAKQMFDIATAIFDTCDAAILAAAVADYRPREVAENKIKKTGDEMVIELVKNPDILGTLGIAKKKGQVLAGFALETNDELEHARQKLEKKNLDFIVLNSLNDKGAGFQYATNKITILHQNNKIDTFELKSKSEVARDIADALAEKMGLA